MQSRTLGNALVHEDDLTAAGVVGGGEEHTVGGHAGDTGGGEVGQNNDLLAHQLVDGVVVLDGGHDNTLADAVVQGQLVAGMGLADLLYLDDLADTDIHLAEVVHVTMSVEMGCTGSGSP